MDFCAVLLESGYSATESTNTLKSLLSHAQISRMSESLVADVLITLLVHFKNHVPKIPPEKPLQSWNPSVLASVALDSVFYPHLPQESIIESRSHC